MLAYIGNKKKTKTFQADLLLFKLTNKISAIYNTNIKGEKICHLQKSTFLENRHFKLFCFFSLEITTFNTYSDIAKKTERERRCKTSAHPITVV